MTAILRRLPYFGRPTVLTVRGEAVRVKAYQIIVWVSVGLEKEDWDPRSVPFPAILDTGHSHNFSTQRRHLVEWGGIHPDVLRPCGHFRELGRRVPLHAACLWLHTNSPGQRDRLTDQPPFRLTLTNGIAVYADVSPAFPRLPLLGLRALTDNHLHLAVSGWRRSVTLRTQRYWWPFD